MLAVAAGLLVLGLPVDPLQGHDYWVLPGLALLVAGAELMQVRFRVGRQIDSSNLVEAAVAPLLVVAPSATGLLAVVVGQLVAGLVRRNPPVKLSFNLAQWSLAFSVGAVLWTSLDVEPVTWVGAVGLVLAVLVVGVVNLLAFTGVLLVMGSDVRSVRPVVGSGWLVGLGVNTALGVLFALAHEAAPGGLLLAPVPLLVLHQAYRGYAAARADRARLAGMHRAASVLAGPLDPRPVIPEFLRAAAELFETRAAVMVLKVEGGREVHRVDMGTGAVDVYTEPEDAATLEAAMTAHLGAVRIDAHDPGPLALALRETGRVDCLAVPMLEGGRVLGALLLLDQVGIEGAPAGQLSVLEALAREVAAAVAKGRLLDSVLEERHKLSTVVSATSDGIAAIDEEGVVRSWNPALVTITGLSEREVLDRADALGRLDPRTPEGEPVDLAGWAAGTRLPGEIAVRSRAGGRRRLACSYSHAEDEHGRTLVVVARDVTPVQEFEALRAEFGRLVAQEAARRLVVEQLQAAVVPDTPSVEGLELAVTYVASDPQEPTGGDLWDWQVLPSGELHIAVVDVLGHGVAATKSALSVVHALRLLALDETPLGDVVARAATLIERQDPDLVATVVVGRLDPTTGRLLVVSGGHPPALVVSGEREVRQVVASGGAIGWPGAGSDGVAEVLLAPGDTVLLYTDGLVEARKDIVLGIDALAAELASLGDLPVEEMTEELVKRALAGADRRDDTLALVVRRGGGPVKRAPATRTSTERWQIQPDRHAAQQLRRDAVRWLADRGIPAGDTALVVAELLANAVRAARGIVVLELSVRQGRLHVAVTDDGPGLVELPDEELPALDGEGNRGLFLVRKLSCDVELDPDTIGTTVRCWLPLASDVVRVPGQVQRDAVS
ncbi:MAG TPA: SpoIIE family protein phosphatase [Mycobacteriales bacterium]|nr:SpoIIE family protein phosphatase [Mycobacteriales bacterium]